MNLDDRVGVNLYAWLTLQRRHKAESKLRPDRLQKLQILVDANKLSWVEPESSKSFDDDEYVHVLPPPPPPSWQSHYDALLVYCDMYGTADVPIGHVFSLNKTTKIDLGSWVDEQRRAKPQNRLENMHIRRLDALAREGKFSWQKRDPAAPIEPVPERVLDAIWQEKYEATVAYVALHPRGCIGDDIDVRLRVEASEGQEEKEAFDLYQWVRAQRMAYFYNTIKPYRKRLLQSLVDRNLFSWMTDEEKAQREKQQAQKEREDSVLWTAWYNALVWLGNNRGECNLSCHGTITLPDDSEAELGKWLHIQKKYIKKGILSHEQCTKILQLVKEGKLDGEYWLKHFKAGYPAGTFAQEFPSLFTAEAAMTANDSVADGSGSSVSNSDEVPSSEPTNSSDQNAENATEQYVV